MYVRVVNKFMKNSLNVFLKLKIGIASSNGRLNYKSVISENRVPTDGRL